VSWRRVLALSCVACGLALRALAAPTPAAPAERRVDRIDAIQDAIHALQLEEAERMLADLDSASANSEAARVEYARLEFFRGHYREAVQMLDAAHDAEKGTPDRQLAALRALCASTDEVTRDFEHLRTPDGRYEVSFPPGKDAVLAPYALEILQRADTALRQVFGTELPSPVRLEIYPTPETLAAVSPLTIEQIQTTGTVALSKWNRLMITSPRALVRGYPWADTIGHELVHLFLSSATEERAPVWLQEGTAKLFERAWRGPDAGLHLEPSALALLQRAAAENRLLTFEQMHPSIAMLPSDEDSALAFAQVATFMQRFVDAHGTGALREALASVRDGADARRALATAGGVTFAALDTGWRRSLTGRGAGTSTRRLKLRFRTTDDPADESSEVIETDARRFLRLGDLLWDRGRAMAATREYEKAHGADPEDPIVAARWGRAALQAGDPASAERALAPQAVRFPGHAPTHAVLGAARLQLGKRVEAAESLREAIRINPFDPQPHCDLANATDDSAEAEREGAACSQLR
jgi:tetratricopeptide (TPR) repeat protein